MDRLTSILHFKQLAWNMQDDFTEKNVNSSVVDFGGSSFLDFRSTSHHSTEKVKATSSEGFIPVTAGSQSSDTDFFDDPKKTASLIRWKDYNNIYPLLGGYGGPTYIHPTKYCCVIGTARGPILIFSVKQILLSRLVPQLAKSVVENDYLRTEVSCIAVSTDGTHLAATYQSGDVFIWNLNSSDGGDSRSSASSTVTEPLKAILHITNHKGKMITGMGFVGARHTALVISDDSGQILYHNGFRSRLWSLTYKSHTIIEFPSGELLRSKLAPCSDRKGSTQLIAVLTRTHFAIVSMDHKPVTLFMESITASSPDTVFTNSCLSWSKDGSLVAVSLNNDMHIFQFSRSHSFALERKSSSTTNESIISLQWVSEQILGILTVSHELLLVDITEDYKPVMELDLLMHDLLIPPDKHVAVRDNEIYALTNYNLKIGKFTTWLDVTLYRVQNGNYIGALNFFETLLKLKSPVANLIKLETDPERKEEQLGRPFFNLALAALRFIFEDSNVNYDDLYQLFSTVLRIIGLFHDEFTRSAYLNSFLEQSLDYFNEENVEVLYEVLVNYVFAGLLTSLPPVVFKNMLEHYAKSKRASVLGDLIMMLNPDMLDIDLAVRICEQYGLFDVLVYIWTMIFNDYQTPFVDAIQKISQSPEESILCKNMPFDEMEKIYDFLSFTLTGRQYPEPTPICSRKLEMKAKTDLYQIIFSGSCIEWPPKSSRKLCTKKEQLEEPAFPYFNLLLQYNPLRCLSTFNEAFEDSYLNDSQVVIDGEAQNVPVSRQTITYIMLDMIRKRGNNSVREAELLAIFISSNASKYPQFIHLSKQDFEKVIDVLFQSEQPSLDGDIQRALESILTLYTPVNTNQFIQQLKEKNFTRVLFSVYTKANRFVDLFLLAIESEDTTRDFGLSIASITQLVLRESEADPVLHSSVGEIIADRFTLLLRRLGPRYAAILFGNFDYQLHNCVVTLHDKDVQLEYLTQAFETSSSQLTQENKKLYIDLTVCQSNKENLLSWLQTVDLKSVDTQYILNMLTAEHKHEEAFVIHYRLEMFSSVVDDMLCCIIEWFDSNDGHYETLDKYLTAATDASNFSRDDKQLNWTKLIACLFNIFGRSSGNTSGREACNHALQKVFIKLAVSDISIKEEGVGQLESILTGVLEHQDIIMKKAQDLKDLLHDVFTAYDIELHISMLILRILEGSSTGMVSYYKDHVQDGKSTCNHECVICGKRIWGLGLDARVFEVWEATRRKSTSLIKSRGAAIVLFFCRHSFHQECLDNLGQTTDAYFCLTCTNKSTAAG